MLDNLVDISGYAESYEDLCKKTAFVGEYFNVLNEKPFMTYRKSEQTEYGTLLETTDVHGWYENKFELESNVLKPNDEDIYITGLSEPYTRWKAVVHGIDVEWVEDGTEDKKILKQFQSQKAFARCKLIPESGIYYAIGKTAPFELYGEISSWEPVGMFISYCVNTLFEINRLSPKIGEVAYCQGLFYIYTEDRWKPIEIIEPMENVSKHSYKYKDSVYKIREGVKLGTLEYFSPR